jgi:hypothetical protein
MNKLSAANPGPCVNLSPQPLFVQEQIKDFEISAALHPDGLSGMLFSCEKTPDVSLM